MALTAEQRQSAADAIVAAGAFPEDQMDSLLALTDNQLVALANPKQLDEIVTANAAAKAKPKVPPKAKDETEDDGKPAPKGKDAPTGNEDGDNKPAPLKPMSEKEWMKLAPASVRNLVANAAKREQAEKEALVEKITANEYNEFEAEELMGLPVDHLERLAKLAVVPTRSSDFSGRPLSVNRNYVQEPLIAPVLDFSNDSN